MYALFVTNPAVAAKSNRPLLLLSLLLDYRGQRSRSQQAVEVTEASTYGMLDAVSVCSASQVDVLSKLPKIPSRKHRIVSYRIYARLILDSLVIKPTHNADVETRPDQRRNYPAPVKCRKRLIRIR